MPRKPKLKVKKSKDKPRSIRVLINYGGKPTNEQRILPGDYYEDDPALFGLADYLAEHPHRALWIDDVDYFFKAIADEQPTTIADMMTEENEGLD